MHHTGMKKRQDTRNVHVQQAFDMTDANGDGHITAHEYASFYVVVAPTFDLSYVQWVQALAMNLPQVDTNGNGTLEVDGMYCNRIYRHILSREATLFTQRIMGILCFTTINSDK